MPSLSSSIAIPTLTIVIVSYFLMSSDCPRHIISDILHHQRIKYPSTQSSKDQTLPKCAMNSIEHRILPLNGINIHVAIKGPKDGPPVLFVHGFPELWYSWRHQMLTLSSLGYRTIAPDLRGYGDSDSPKNPSNFTIFLIVGDLIALLDNLAPEEQVFVVGHDWGAIVAWYLSWFRPDRVKAMVNLSVHFTPRDPNRKPIEAIRAIYGDDHYICRFQQPGDIEAEFAEMGTERVLREFFSYRSPAPLFLPKGKGFGNPEDATVKLPSWMSEQEFKYFAGKFAKKGFTGGLNYYRNLDANWELTAAWTGVQVKVPVKFIVGGEDLVYNSLGAKEYVQGGGLKKLVPFMQEVVVMEGAGHFINQEKPEEISQHIHDFFRKF